MGRAEFVRSGAECRPTRPMRIGFVIGGLGGGGAERQLSLVAAGLSARGHDVRVYAEAEGPWRPWLEDRGVEVACFPSDSTPGRVGRRIALIRAVRRSRPDVLHPYLTSTNAWVALTRGVTRPRLLVWGVRDSGTQTFDTRKSRAAWWLSRRMSSRADLIVYNSAAGATNYLALGYRPAGVAVVSNGIDTDRFRPDETARRQWREDNSLGTEELVVGMIARDDPVKGHEDLVAAASLLRQRGDGAGEATFIIVGGLSDHRARVLHSAATAAGVRLRTLPATDAPERFYNGIDVFVMPSRRSEGFPNVLGEALACGRAAVASDVGDVRDVLGGTGVIVPPSDPSALADGIGQAARTLPGLRADEVRRSISSRYSVETLVDATEALLMEHLARHQ